MNTSKFQGELLQKIYKGWLWRELLPVVIGEIIVLSVLVYFVGRAIFVQKVIENILTILFANPKEIFEFMAVAFTKTTTAAKLIGIGLLVALALFVRHITQGILRFILIKENYFSRVGNRS